MMNARLTSGCARRFWQFAVIAISISAAGSALAQERLDDMMMLYEVERLLYVEGSPLKAREVASELLSRIGETSEIHETLTPLVQKFSKATEEPQESIKYATGTKDEFFCRGAGLVYLQAQHNNGMMSEVRVISSNRKLDGDFGRVMSGDCVYELDTSYREPIRSESWIVKTTPSSYSIAEVRVHEPDIYEEGRWIVSWTADGNYTDKTKTSGNMREPIPMYMANSYIFWGTSDIGARINFKVGSRDEIRGQCNGLINTIHLKTQRSVDEHLKEFSYTDASGEKHSYSDCYKVHSVIELDRLEPFKTGQYSLK